MTTPSRPALIDTNVLVYALFSGAPNHAASRALVDQAQVAGAGLCVAPQTMAEFFAVVTNPRRVNPAKSAADALSAAEAIVAMPGMSVVPAPADVVTRWVQLVRQRPVTGAKVFDVQLVATMLANGISTIYTFNVPDFQPFQQIQVLTP
jgi:toxin-antitoxin system PIN domain toxin